VGGPVRPPLRARAVTATGSELAYLSRSRRRASRPSAGGWPSGPARRAGRTRRTWLPS
jgi:hypothetical protein